MRTIQCDVCEEVIEAEKQIDLGMTVDGVLVRYANMKDPDLCESCIDNLERAIRGALFDWQLAKGKKT